LIFSIKIHLIFSIQIPKTQSFQMKPIDALSCLVGPAEPTHLIGFCGPNTSDPRLALRSFALMPNQPTFQVGEIYYFVGEFFLI
jgi:hypothetical protein